MNELFLAHSHAQMHVPHYLRIIKMHHLLVCVHKYTVYNSGEEYNYRNHFSHCLWSSSLDFKLGKGGEERWEGKDYLFFYLTLLGEEGKVAQSLSVLSSDLAEHYSCNFTFARSRACRLVAGMGTRRGGFAPCPHHSAD